MACPKTLFVAVKLALPSALNKASLFANIFITLSSQKAIKSPSAVDLEYSFCILP